MVRLLYTEHTQCFLSFKIDETEQMKTRLNSISKRCSRRYRFFIASMFDWIGDSMISSLAIERLHKEISCLENTLNRSDLLALNYKYAREYPSIRHASGIFSTIRNKENNTWSCNRYISSTDLISVSIKFLSLSRVIPVSSTPLYYTKIHRHLQF